MNKKISIGIAVSLIIIAVTITFTATMIFSMNMFDSKVSSAQQRASMHDKLSEIDKVARQNFYGEIDDSLLNDAIARGYMSGLEDADSVYLTAAEIAARTAEMDGTAVSVGLGVERNANGYAVVNNVVAESSAEKMEMQAGDIITKIDDQDVLTIGYDAAAELLTSGAENSKINVTYNRSGEEAVVELTRATTESVAVSSTLIDNLYFIRIDKFSGATLTQFRRAVQTAQSTEGVIGIIFDVRDTSGGYDISIIANMLDLLLPTGTMISGNYAGDQVKVLYTSDDKAVNLPMAVLVNEKTTGFAELFAAVLGDADNCRVVGSKTAGKGKLQQLIKLTDGSGVDVTVATLLAPKSGAFDGVGVKLDAEVAVSENFVRTATPDEMTDAQYKRAADAVRAM